MVMMEINNFHFAYCCSFCNLDIIVFQNYLPTKREIIKWTNVIELNNFLNFLCFKNEYIFHEGIDNIYVKN